MIDPIELKPASKAAQVKVIRVPAGARKQVVFRLVDQQGAEIDLTSEPKNEPAEAPVFGTEKQVSPLTVSVKLRARDQYFDSTIQIDLNGKILEDQDCKGLVEFDLTSAETSIPGVYLCEVGRFVTGDYLVDTWPVYFAIEPSVFADLTGRPGPLTIPEIRLGMGDLQVGEVSLLDDLEFDDAEILYAIRQVVDLWNETPPHIRIATYTTQNFPYRYHWIKGTVATLYGIAAKKYLRNQLNYQAGGITIDDQNKYQQYLEFSKVQMDEFKEWMIREKIRLNMTLAWHTGL